MTSPLHPSTSAPSTLVPQHLCSSAQKGERGRQGDKGKGRQGGRGRERLQDGDMVVYGGIMKNERQLYEERANGSRS